MKTFNIRYWIKVELLLMHCKTHILKIDCEVLKTFVVN